MPPAQRRPRAGPKALVEGGLPALLDGFRSAPVKHADETTWSCDGRHGYAWGFFTPDVSLYRFRASRGAAVADEVFGRGCAAHQGYGSAWG